MAFFELNGKTFFIDNRLKEQIDKKVIPDLKKKDKDCVFLIDGNERTGKSVFGMTSLGGYIASQLKTDYNLSNICMTPSEFRNRIMKSQKNEVVIYDEAHRGMASSRALSEINNILRDMMMEMGQKNLLVIIILPTFFLLDKYVALFRARGLFHVYEQNGKRGYWVYFNQKNKLKLYMKGRKELNYNCMRWPAFRGRFFNQYAVNEESYREKKRRSFEEKPRMTRVEDLLNQRNSIIYMIWDTLLKGNAKTQKNLAKLLKSYGVALDRRTVSDILNEKLREIAKKKGEADV